MADTNAEQGKSLVNCEVVLNPKMSGMYIDPANQFTLSFFSDGKDRIKVTEKMDTTFLRKNIRAGILFVFKDGKNISTPYGGGASEDWSRKPIVEVPKPADLTDDDRYLKVLNRNKQELIIQTIQSVKDLPTLERLKELEKKGNNPSAQCRADVLNAIEAQIKQIPGVGPVKEFKEDNEKVTLK